ncbi:MAG TPA: MoaD/ThiS family protein [Noviherbaspirillum sp.]|nr:MoaD/ThiS family protein [Noviherbaspirillum sp.]
MPTLIFTQQLRRFIPAPEVTTAAATLRAALEDAFGAHPQLRGYVLDDQGHLRRHLTVFIDGRRLRDHADLSDPLQPASKVHVMQALSGG